MLSSDIYNVNVNDDFMENIKDLENVFLIFSFDKISLKIQNIYGLINNIMKIIKVIIETDSDFRATEIPADLKIAAETLFYPLKSIGIYDKRTGEHPCRKQPCNHMNNENSDELIRNDLEKDFGATCEIYFITALVHVFLR